MPPELPDDYPIEQYLVDLMKHAAFINAGQPGYEENQVFEFSINARGEIRASLTVPVSVSLGG